MTNVPSLFCPDPIISILQFYNSVTIGTVQHPDIQQLLNETPFPTISPKEINNIIANRKKGQPYSQIMKNISFKFDFKNDFLLTMNQNYVLKNADFEATVKIVLFSYISFIFEIEKTQTIHSDHLKILFNSLMFLDHSPNIELLQDVFFHLFVIYLETPFNDEDFTIVYSYLRTFIFTTKKSFSRTEKFINRVLFKLIPAESTTFSPNAILILSLLSDLISKFQQTFSPTTAENILFIISNELLVFDQMALQIFSNLISFVNNEKKSQYIEMISQTLNIYISQSNYKFKISNKKLPMIETESTAALFRFPYDTTSNEIESATSDSSSNLNSDSSSNPIILKQPNLIEESNSNQINFDNQIDLSDKSNWTIHQLPLYDSYFDLLDENISKIVVSIANSLKNQPDILTKLFTSIGKNIKSSDKILNSISLFVVFYYEIHRVIPSHSLPQTMLFLSPNDIFNQNIICDDSMIALNTLRHFAFGLIMNESEITIASLIQNAYKSPFFLEELIMRIHNHKNRLMRILSNSKLILTSIAKSMSIIQKWYFDGRFELNSVRLTFLKFVLMNIYSGVFQKAILDDEEFVSVLLSFVFDPSIELRKVTFNCFHKFLIESKSSSSNLFINFRLIFDYLNRNLGNDDHSQLEIDLINSFCSILNERPERNSSFESLNKSLFSSIHKLKKTKKCETLFLLIIQFFVKMNHSLSINLYEKDLMKNATNLLYNNDPPLVILQSFMELLIMDSNDLNNSLHVNSNMLIQHEFVLPLIFETFQHTVFRKQVVDLFDVLLDNPENIHACNVTSFDKYLLEIFSSDCLKNQDLKPLFTKIVLNSTTIPVVLKFLSLLSPKRLQSIESISQNETSDQLQSSENDLPQRSRSGEFSKSQQIFPPRSNSTELSESNSNEISLITFSETNSSDFSKSQLVLSQQFEFSESNCGEFSNSDSILSQQSTSNEFSKSNSILQRSNSTYSSRNESILTQQAHSMDLSHNKLEWPQRSLSSDLSANESNLTPRSNSSDFSQNETADNQRSSKIKRRLIDTSNLEFPSNFPLLFEYFDELLRKSLEHQFEVIYLDKSIDLEPIDITFNENKRSFTFCCWLYIDKMIPNYFPRLFTVTDDNDHLIEVFISMQQIRIQIDPKKSHKSLMFNYTIPINQWTLIALSFQFDDHALNDEIICIDVKDQYLSDNQVLSKISKHDEEQNNNASESVEFSNLIDEFQSNGHFAASANSIHQYIQVDLIITNEIVSSLSINKKFMNDRKSRFSFCGSLPNSLHTNFPTKVGPFGVFDLLSLNEISQIAQQAQRFFGRCLSSKHIQYYLNQPYNHGPRDKISSFSALFVMKCKFELLSPIFRFLSVPIESGIEFSNFLDILFSIFHHYVHFGSIVEVQLKKSNVFGIIQQILQENDSSDLNYSLYLKFYELLTVLQTDELKLDLLQKIVINLYLWQNSSDHTQLDIYNHWINSVYPNYIHIINQFYSFSLFFCDIAYTLHNKKSSSICFSQTLYKNAIKTMFQIMNFFKFQIDDFCILLSYLSFTKSIFLINQTSQFIKNQIDKENFEEIFRSNESLIAMEKVILNGHNDAIKSMIEIILILHKKLIIRDISLNDHIHLIINEISKFSIDKDFIKSLFNTTNSLELFSFECWIASTNPNTDFCYILNNVEPSPAFICGENWSFWPIYFMVQNSSLMKITEKMMTFLAVCTKYDKWIDIYYMIEVISNLVRKPSSKLKRLFIQKTFDIIKSDKIQFSKLNPMYTQCVYQFMFYRDMRFDSIEEVYQNSPFCEFRRSSSISFPNDTNDTDFKRSRSLTFDNASKFRAHSSKNFVPPKPIFKFKIHSQEIKVMFSQNELKQNSSVFGARFDPFTLQWLDKGLAEDLLTFLYNDEEKYFVDFKLLLAFFFLHDKNNNVIIEYLKHVKINDKSSISQPLIDLICQRMRINGIDNHPFLSHQSGNGQIKHDSSFFDAFPKKLENEEKIVNNYYQICKKYHLKIYDLVEKYQNEKTRIAFPTSLKSFKKKQYQINKENKTDWKRLYLSFTIPRTPWNSIHSDRTIKISSKLCKNHFPFTFSFDHNNNSDNSNFYNRFLFSPHFKEQNCQIITNKSMKYCQIKINNDNLVFIYPNDKIKSFPLTSIANIWQTTVFLRQTAFEMVFKTGESFIVNFMNNQQCLEIYHQLLPYAKELSLDQLTFQWKNREISNFEYLLNLNFLSGRSFNNLTQYPIFPWIFADYKSSTLDLGDKDIYRDFSKPIGALSNDKLTRYFDMMNNTLKSQRKLTSQPEFPKKKRNSAIIQTLPLLNQKENDEDSLFLYPKAINTTLDVLSYLNSFEPFSTIYQEAKQQNLELYDFSSISDLFHKLLEKTSPFLSELIPEFFSFFEILNNCETLPPWAHNSMEFVYMNRKALETDFVSMKLPQWIDLIWGYKQSGSPSLNNLNNYDPKLYVNSDLISSNLNELVDQDKEKIIKGIIPKQLFDEPHPPKIVVIHSDTLKQYSMKAKITKQLVFASIVKHCGRNSSNAFEVIGLDCQNSIITIKAKRKRDSEEPISKNSKDNSIDHNPYVSELEEHAFKLPPEIKSIISNHSNFNDMMIINSNDKHYLISHDNIIPLPNQFYCFASDEKIMVGIGTDSLLYFYSYDNFPEVNEKRPIYRENPLCAAISGKFHICVIGSIDGLFSIYPIGIGSSIFSFDIKCKPKEILITNNLGFIITYAITRKNVGRLFVHSINGTFITSSYLSVEITAITTLQSKKGLDYVVFAIKEGNIFICEAFTLKSLKNNIKLDPPIISLKYIKNSALLVVVNASGIITCISLENLIL